VQLGRSYDSHRLDAYLPIGYGITQVVAGTGPSRSAVIGPRSRCASSTLPKKAQSVPIFVAVNRNSLPVLLVTVILNSCVSVVSCKLQAELDRPSG
jgi:hypothetical protein